MNLLSGGALLGARIDGIDPSPLVAAIYMVSGILMLCALWLRAEQAGHRIAMAGIALAMAAALYGHDVINLPEIASVLVVGGGIGLLLVRRCVGQALPWLIVAGHGLLGMAAMATVSVLALNPVLFGLVGEDGTIASANGLLLVAAFAMSLMVVGGALLMAFCRTHAALALVGGGAGWSTAALGFALGNSAMVMAGAFAGMAGFRLGWREHKVRPAA